MKAIHQVIGTLGVVALASTASAVSARTSSLNDQAAQFMGVEATMQQESTSMPYESAPDAKSTPSADPLPGATGKRQKRDRFGAEEKELQSESTSMPPAVKPPSTAPSDPVPSAPTRADKRARFEQQEREMQQESTP